MRGGPNLLDPPRLQEPHVYELLGLRVITHMALERAPRLLGNGPLDDRPVHIAMDKSALEQGCAWDFDRNVPGQAGSWLRMRRTPEGYVIRVHETADFRLNVVNPDADWVLCTPLPGCELTDLDHLVFDHVLPLLLQLRCRPCFHASAAEVADGVAVAFLGESGSGKSTTASYLASCLDATGRPRGLVADDALALRSAAPQEGFWIEPGYPSARLWQDSLGALDLPFTQHAQRKARAHLQPSGRQMRLGMLCLLEKSVGPSAQSVSLERVGGAAAVVKLAQHLHRLDPQLRAALRGEMSLLSDLAAKVPVYVLHIPRVEDADAACMQTSLEAVKELLVKSLEPEKLIPPSSQ
jgi:ABC-type uncharacterized transport system YnjBCD ATPase subunit